MVWPASRCVLLDPGVPDYVFSIDQTKQGWASIDLKKKRYQGCGRYGPLLAESVKLYARLAEEHPALSRLAVCADKNIIRDIVAEELKKKQAFKVADLPIRAIEFGNVDEISGVTARVEVADKNLMVLSLSFVFTSSKLKHYLLYDAIHASMSMIPIPNWKPRFPKETPASFCHHVKFTSSSHAFRADLTKGVLCCRIKDLMDSFFVHFDFIELPPGCKSDALDDSDTGPAEMFRTMGCGTGDLIKFVSISFDDSVPEDDIR
ncbi:hypothetical protein OsI_13587 [Oryza sativa Indica Group]|uniref:DUF1618 domain-containing protein n=3 Tax=Oryza sativa TaxID=4530 RepID=A3AMT6_ORYSJ|nr:hypothetical protein [Oryza sativa Japonica Group]ABF98944.1 hypothetical protein LOC_Os03g54820 [Oryza sativa Japonica Group]EAY91905.1 hypothetical protein OsI_13587 [Oryza sativa Indica Group]EAZ28625.1 hypothetical protein OsJ_12614 [Oryza sativa Japonica Group]